MMQEGQLRAIKDQLKAAEGILVKKEKELKVTKSALEEEILVRKAHQDMKINLDTVALGLKKVTSKSIANVQIL